MDMMEDDFGNAKHNDESDEMVDPTMFLERTADEGEEPLMVIIMYTWSEATSWENRKNSLNNLKL